MISITMNTIQYFIFFMLILLTTKCQKPEEKEDLTMYYKQTQCDDKWGAAFETNPQTIINYFDSVHNFTLNAVFIEKVSDGHFC